MAEVLIGVDGGGTKTTLLAVNAASGEVVGKATVGSIHALSFGTQTAMERLRKGIVSLQLSKDDHIIGIALGDPAIDDTSVATLSGAPMRQAVQDEFGCPCFSKSDVFMALYAFTGGTSGAFLVAGTGSMGVALPASYDHSSENRVLTVGGWGNPTYDPGSGCSIAVQAICAAIKAFDGVGPATTLCDELLSFYSVEQPRDLINILNAQGITRGDMAAFAKQVDACARAGDTVALGILTQAGRDLADYACRMLSEMTCPNIGIYGSVLLNNQTVRRIFEQQVLERFPQATIRIPENPPEYGAVLFAADALGIDRRKW